VVPTTCTDCKDIHGKIYETEIKPIEYKQHINCKCEAPAMRTKSAGTATQKGVDGADFYLKYLKKLPDYYVLKGYALSEGWRNTYKFVENSVPGKMIGGDLYNNKDGKLPEKDKWYEADLDYTKGKRNSKRFCGVMTG
jgi:hypothetical protein